MGYPDLEKARKEGYKYDSVLKVKKLGIEIGVPEGFSASTDNDIINSKYTFVMAKNIDEDMEIDWDSATVNDCSLTGMEYGEQPMNHIIRNGIVLDEDITRVRWLKDLKIYYYTFIDEPDHKSIQVYIETPHIWTRCHLFIRGIYSSNALNGFLKDWLKTVVVTGEPEMEEPEETQDVQEDVTISIRAIKDYDNEITEIILQDKWSFKVPLNCNLYGNSRYSITSDTIGDPGHYVPLMIEMPDSRVNVALEFITPSYEDAIDDTVDADECRDDLDSEIIYDSDGLYVDYIDRKLCTGFFGMPVSLIASVHLRIRGEGLIPANIKQEYGTSLESYEIDEIKEFMRNIALSIKPYEPAEEDKAYDSDGISADDSVESLRDDDHEDYEDESENEIAGNDGESDGDDIDEEDADESGDVSEDDDDPDECPDELQESVENEADWKTGAEQANEDIFYRDDVTGSSESSENFRAEADRKKTGGKIKSSGKDMTKAFAAAAGVLLAVAAIRKMRRLEK